MRNTVLLALFVSLPAFATGEKVLLTGNNPLRDTLCFSMECVDSGAHDMTIAAKAVKGAVELTVKSATGQVKLVTRAGVNDEGEVSATDLIRATSLIVKSIEAPAFAAETAAVAAAEKERAADRSAAKKASAKASKKKHRALVANR